MFDPSNWASGTAWRLLQANASYTSSLGSTQADRLWLKAGWVQPRYEFALQPMTDRILNNAVNSAKGIGGNIPFSSSFSTWGGMGRVHVEPLYTKLGVSNRATATRWAVVNRVVDGAAAGKWVDLPMP